MKLCIFLLVIFFQCTFAGTKDLQVNRTSHELSDSSRPYLTLSYDANFMERAGAENILTLHYGETRLEDYFLGTRWFPENTFFRKTGGVLLRFTKTVLLDFPFDVFTYVFAHEYYGHGTHFKELTDNEIKYHFSPVIYGTDENWTYAVGSIPLSYQGFLAIEEGGIEIQQILNNDIAMNWMTTDKMNYREAFLYFLSFLNYYPSTMHTPDNTSIYNIQNDASDYFVTMNTLGGYTGRNNLKLSLEAFHSRMALSIVNPFVFYSMYCFLKTYLWDGNTVSGFPTIRIGSVNYLPVLKSGLTPYGIEYHLENYLRFGKTTSRIDFGIGDQTFYASWGDLGLSFQNIVSRNRWSVDMNVDLWKQPELMIHGDQMIWSKSRGNIFFAIQGRQPKDIGFGGAVSMRGYYRFSNSKNSLAGMVELGYKSTGYLEGYSLSSSPIIMVGIGFHPF